MKRKMKYFISLLLSLALVMQWGGESVLTSAAVTDNVSVAKVETLIGSPITDTEPQSLFAYLREILTTVVAMSGQLTTLGQQMDTVANNVGNLKATAGGGCYYTVYTKKSYLNGYKLKLTDRTTAKSCFITRDDDSGYWAGIVRVPLADNIYIEIIDATTGKSQGEVSTTAVTTSGYATINLDPLLLSFLNNLVNVDDSLALHLSSDSAIIQNDTYFPIVMKHVYTVNHDVDKFLTALNGMSYTSKTFDELLNNETDFVNAVVGNTAYRTVLSQQEFTDRLINNRSLLRQISYNARASKTAQDNNIFFNSIHSSTLIQQVTGTVASPIQLTGNFICLYMKSCSRGDYTYMPGYKYYGKIDQHYACVWGSVETDCGRDCFGQSIPSGSYVRAYRTNFEEETIIGWMNQYCIQQKTVTDFCTKITASTVAAQSFNVQVADWGDTVSVSATTPRQGSVIQYIDLDAED